MGIQNSAQTKAVGDACLQKEPCALPSPGPASLQRERYQVLGIDHANGLIARG